MITRHSLLAMLTEYMQALADDDPSGLPVSAKLRATSNGEPTPLGHGAIWGGARRIVFRQPFVEPETGAAIMMATVTKAGKANPEAWWFYCLRLRVEGDLIAEVEEVSYDGVLLEFQPSLLESADRIWDTVVPEDERSTPDELVAVANAYFDAVSGILDPRTVPFAPDCRRRELGAFTTDSLQMPGSARGGLMDPSFRWDVVNRRVYVRDQVRGVVVAIANFMTPEKYPDNNGSVVFEAFKIQDGLIRHIEAMFRNNGQPRSGWGEGNESR